MKMNAERGSIVSALCASLLSAAFPACAGDAIPLAFPFEETCVVKGCDVSADFAVREFNLIVSNATGRTFATGSSDGCRRRIFIGRSAAAEAAVGAEAFKGLRDEESVVFARGCDLFLIGGGQLGALYAVYDFLEDNLNFRHYFKRDDGFVVDKVPRVVYGGKPTRRIPVFRGYRSATSNWSKSEWLTHVRNRSNATAQFLIPAFKCGKWRQNISGHGFLYYLPPYDPDPRNGWRPKGIRGMFKEHPEYFSLGQDGKRHDDMQLCLSNPATRDALYAALELWIRAKGDGIYMVGSNDNHNTRYCWCDGCVALEKKYDSVGGPLWEFILEACERLKKNPAYAGVMLQTLAYKGPNQTERAPKGVERFPDNFVCDAAFLNSDRELSAVFDEKLPDGTVFNRLANLRRWRELCANLSYWYYGGSNPAQLWVRMQREVKELRDCGVDAIFGCGTGGGIEFGDFTTWMFYRLLRDPDFDLEPDIRRIFALKYGPAACKVREYADMLQSLQRKAIEKLRITTGCDSPYSGFSFLEGEDIIRLRKVSDAALGLARGTEFEHNVLVSRIGLNIFTMRYFHKIRTAAATAAAKIDCGALSRETRATIDKLGLEGARRAYAMSAVTEMANYSNLKSDELPPELASYPKDKVFRILPPERSPHICGNVVPGVYTCEADPKAASGWAWTDSIPAKRDISGGVTLELYSDLERQWLVPPSKNPIPLSNFRKGEYTLWRFCETRIPSRVCIVVAGNWGGPTAVKLLGRLFDPSYQNRQWEIWISSRGEGPKFFADESPDAPSRIWIDQIFCVDKGVPDGK